MREKSQGKLVIILVLILAMACLGGINPPAHSQGGEPGRRELSSKFIDLDYVPGQVIVKYREGLSAQQMEETNTPAGVLSVLDNMRMQTEGEVQLLELKPDALVEDAINSLRSSPQVIYAEPNYVYRYVEGEATWIPNDPNFIKQWGFNNTGQTIRGVPGVADADIDAPEAWLLEKGWTNPVTVAVIDSGIDLNHPDLQSKLWVNSDENPINGIDDDGNGYVDDYNGYNWSGISQTGRGYEELFGYSLDTRAFAQSIKGTGAYLSQIGIYLSKVGSPNQVVNVSIRSGLYDAPIAECIISPVNVPSYPDYAYFSYPFMQPVYLEDGNTYYIGVETWQNNTLNHYAIWSNDNVYADGEAYIWNGSSWIAYPDYDLYFQTNPNCKPRDDNGHGTHCAGIVGAKTNNGVGVAGTSPGARIMPLKVGSCSGGPTSWTSSQAIYYAADNGADILSMSFGGSSLSSAQADAVSYAYQKGVTMFAAVGNNGDTTILYPAGCNNVIGIAATDNKDVKAEFSTYNSSVDISAPGVNIYSTVPTYAVSNTISGDPLNYAFYSGTSMACPMAAGVGALILSRNPAYTPSQVQDVMQSNADDLGTVGWDNKYGHGRINAYNTLNAVALPLPHIDSISPTSGVVSTVVTITGTDFGATRGTSYVKFGGAVATNYVSWSNTQVKVKVPAAASGAVNLSLTTAAGRSNLMAFKVKPRITKLSPLSGTPGTVVTITGTGFGTRRGTSYVRFGITKVATYVSWSTTVIKVKVPSTGVGTKLVRVITSGGTSNGVSFTVK